MKKSIIALVAILATATCAQAQLKVLSNGNIKIGDDSITAINKFSSGQQTATAGSGLDSFTGVATAGDTLASISILGPKTNNSGGYISFGARKDVTIGESVSSPALNFNKGRLLLVGNGGMSYKCGNQTIMSYNPMVVSTTVGTPAVDFSIPVSAVQFLTTSDSRYKKNIESIENMGRLLDGVTPVSYVLDMKAMAPQTDGEASKVSAQAEEQGTVQYGFLAQEVREIFPELVHEDADGMLSIDYNGFIPLLVDAVKNLSAKVEAQEAVIEQLSAPSVGRKSVAGVEDIDEENAVSMSQNRPNPFRETTEIKCHLPETVGTAFLCVYDLNGRQQLRQDIDGRGDVTVTISGSTLAPGLYIYSLIADGIEAATKRMILTD